MPAMAAAFGVFRCARVRVPFSSIGLIPYCASALGNDPNEEVGRASGIAMIAGQSPKAEPRDLCLVA